jgi:hypothetical protein
MGYFANGSEGMYWEMENCERCVHMDNKDGCPVWMAHQLYNYEQHREGQKKLYEVLDMLIPRSRSGLENLKCKMLILKEE